MRKASERLGDRPSCCTAGHEDPEELLAKKSWLPLHAGKGRRQILP